MNSKILFLDGNSEEEFYNTARNKYKNVHATSIFIKNNIYFKIIRRLLLKARIPFLPLLFGKWKSQLDRYDLFIISASFYSNEIHQYILNKKNNSRIIHWYWNPVTDGVMPYRLGISSYELWSFDKKDCQKYCMNYIPTYYFSHIILDQNEIEFDVYFIGADKGRLDKLIEVQKIIESVRLKANFHITKSKGIKPTHDYQFMRKISYNKVLENISKSRAILDYVQPGQEGLTQRTMESIFLKKKLITNDKNIVNYDFYKKENIFILENDPLDELSEFVKSKYVTLEPEIIKKYDFDTWLNYLLSNKNNN